MIKQVFFKKNLSKRFFGSASRIKSGITNAKTLKSLKNTEQKFKLFSDHLPGAAYIKDGEGRYVFLNSYFEKNLNLDTGSMLGRKNEDIFPPDTAKKLRENDLEVLSENKAVVFEENIGAGEDKKTFLSYKFPIPDPQGTMLGGISLDITSRKTVEEQLEKNKRKFEDTLKLLQDIVFETNKEGRITYINHSGKKVLGKEGDAPGLGLLDIVAKKDRMRVEKEYLATIENKHKRHRLFEFSILACGGEELPVIGYIGPILGKGDRIEGARAVLVDIDELKKKEKALAESEERYRRLFDNSRDGIYLSTLEGKYLDANPALVKMLGYASKRELVSKDISSEIYIEKKKRPSPEQRDKPFEARFRKKDGKPIWVEISSRAIYKGGKPAYYQGIVRDISERKRYERQLRYKSFHDSLTSLYNRAYFEEELKRLNNNRQLPLSIIIGDVNCLKLVNDAFGHQKGDRLLQEAANIIKKSCRKGDIIARWGGDEFAVLLPKTSETAADEAAKRIRENAEGSSILQIPISLSLGRETKVKEGEKIQVVIRKAEDKMYRQKLLEKKEISYKVLLSLQETLFQKSYYNREHADRVRDMALSLGASLSLSEENLKKLALLAVYHDIGKISVDDHIFKRKEPLTADQWRQIKRHPEVGYNIADALPQLSHIAEAILSHHERWDGKGYPQGLKGEQVPLLARILSVVDAYDVMRHGCTYKGRMTKEQAIDELRQNSGTQFDPHIIDAFLELIQKD